MRAAFLLICVGACAPAQTFCVHVLAGAPAELPSPKALRPPLLTPWLVEMQREMYAMQVLQVLEAEGTKAALVWVAHSARNARPRGHLVLARYFEGADRERSLEHLRRAVVTADALGEHGHALAAEALFRQAEMLYRDLEAPPTYHGACDADSLAQFERAHVVPWVRAVSSQRWRAERAYRRVLVRAHAEWASAAALRIAQMSIAFRDAFRLQDARSCAQTERAWRLRAPVVRDYLDWCAEVVQHHHLASTFARACLGLRERELSAI